MLNHQNQLVELVSILMNSFNNDFVDFVLSILLADPSWPDGFKINLFSRDKNKFPPDGGNNSLQGYILRIIRMKVL